MSTWRWWPVLALLVVSMPAGRALAWPPLEEGGPRTPLLGGRWTVLLGPDATVAPAVSDPRAPAPRVELDGVAAIRSDEGRLALRSTMLFGTRPADLEAVVRTLPAPCEAPVVAPFPEHEGVIAITCSEPSPDGAFRPVVLYAAHPDGWVDRFEVQLETDEATDQAAAAAFARAVAESLQSATAAPAIERGTVEVGRACAAGDVADAFTITLPEEWIATRQGDSIVQLVRVAELGTRRPIASIAFLPRGMSPARMPAGMGTVRAGTLLGTEVEWLEIVGPGDAPGIRELALSLSVACGDDTAPWTGTVQLSAGGPAATLDESTRVLETFALTSARGHTVAVTPLGTEAEPEDVPVAGPRLPDPEEEEAAEQTSHLWSMGIGAASLLMLVLALVLRARTTRPK